MTSKMLGMLDRQMNQIKTNNSDHVQLKEFKKDFFYVPGFGNVGIVFTSEGVVIIDTGRSRIHAEKIYNQLRQLTKLPIRYIIYTHGHIDHVNSAVVFKENETKVISHENVKERFKKYEMLKEHRQRIRAIQFDNNTDDEESYALIYPDISFHREYEFTLGGKTFQIIHGKGETDDQCFVYIPEDSVVYSGDFFIWSFPNIGNPLKEVRFEKEWYEALEEIKEKQPEFLIPGHGKMLEDKAEIQQALQDVIDCLRFVHDNVIHYLNKGTSLEDMLELIKLPKHLETSKYITPSYGCLMFAIKGTHRRYSGWFDGNPTNLEPAKQSDIAKEMLTLISNTSTIFERSKQLFESGDYQMALHLIDLLAIENDNIEAKQLKAAITKKLSETNENFIMRNIYKQLAIKLQAEIVELN